jgi:hypothetical protein
MVRKVLGKEESSLTDANAEINGIRDRRYYIFVANPSAHEVF